MGYTYREQFNRKYGKRLNASNSLKDISKLTRISLKKLQKVFDRGIGAYKTNPRSVRIRKNFSKNPDMRKYPLTKRLTAEQWAYARVYSTVMNYFYWKKTGVKKGAFKYDSDIIL